MNDQLSYTAKAGRLVQFLGFINLAILVIVAVARGVNYFVTAEPVAGSAVTAFAIAVALAVAFVFVGSEMKKHKKWAIVLGWVIGIISLFNFPIGTIIGAFVLYYLYQGRNEPAAESSRAPVNPHEWG